MVFAGIDSTYIISQLAQALYSLRAEITIFLAAFCAHTLLFGRYRIISKKPQQGLKAKSAKGQQSSSADAKVPMAMEDICKGCGGKPEAIAAKLRAQLAKVPADVVPKTLCALLQASGRVPPAELLQAVREAAKEASLPLNAALGESLLHGYYGCRLIPEFDALLSEIESTAAAEGAKLFDGVGVQALKGALRSEDFDEALKRLQGIRRMWGDSATSPSAAPKALLQWLSRLSLQQNYLPKFIEKLKDMSLLAEAFHPILTECAQHGSAATLGELEALGRKEGLAFTDTTYCLLLKGNPELQHATQIFSAAVASVGVSKELVTAATGVAVAHGCTTFADAIVKKLPVDAPAEATGKLLQLCAGSNADDAKILSLYTQYFAKLDLSGDAAAEQLIAQACINLNRLDVLKKMLMTTTDCTKRVALIKKLGTAGRLDDVFVVFRTYPERGACLYNAVIDACIETKRPEDAQQIISETIAAGVADIVTYNTIIKAHLLAGKNGEAQKTVQLMKFAGLAPNCVTFNELLDACVRYKVGDVWPLLDEMKACNVKPNHITCSILLKTIRADSPGKNVERTLDVLDSMNEEMDEVLLSSVVEACIRAGRVDLLVPHLKRQTSSRRVQVHGPHTYGSIIRAYGFVNDMAGAWETWREMRTRRIVPTAVTLGCMVEAVVSNGEPEAGYDLIQDMLTDDQCKPLLNAVIYCSVLKGFSHQKKFDRLWSVYEEMLEKKLQFSIVTFNTMVDACSRSGEMSRVSGLLHSMVAQGIEPNLITYSAILKGYCQENRLDEAFEIMQGMVQTTRFKPDEIMYNTLLDGCARQGLYDRGIAVLKDMEAAGIRPSNFTLSVLVKLCSRAKKLDRAFEIVAEMAAKYNIRLNVHVFTNMVQACIHNRDNRRAFEMMEKMLNEQIRPDTRTYSLLLRACIAAGEPHEAAGLMRAAAGLRGVHPRLMGYAANLLQPQGGLPSALISEVIEGISGPCREERLAVALLKDLKLKPNIKVDPKLQMRLTTEAVGSTRRQAW